MGSAGKPAAAVILSKCVNPGKPLEQPTLGFAAEFLRDSWRINPNGIL
jgi:hypothetical protein